MFSLRKTLPSFRSRWITDFAWRYLTASIVGPGALLDPPPTPAPAKSYSPRQQKNVTGYVVGPLTNEDPGMPFWRRKKSGRAPNFVSVHYLAISCTSAFA